jgi:hypothetical protein
MFSTGWVDQFLLSFDRAIKRVRIVDCQEENQFTWHSPIAHSLGFIPSLAALLVLLRKVEPPAICSRQCGVQLMVVVHRSECSSTLRRHPPGSSNSPFAPGKIAPIAAQFSAAWNIKNLLDTVFSSSELKRLS